MNFIKRLFVELSPEVNVARHNEAVVRYNAIRLKYWRERYPMAKGSAGLRNQIKSWTKEGEWPSEGDLWTIEWDDGTVYHGQTGEGIRSMAISLEEQTRTQQRLYERWVKNR